MISGGVLQPVFAQVGYAGHASLFGHCVAAPRVARTRLLRMIDDIGWRLAARLRPSGLRRARFALRALRGCATRSPEGEAWWSQAGSNRRPRHCERRYLPSELWPHRDRIELIEHGQQSRHLNLPPGQVKNAEIVVFLVICRELPLFEGGRTDI